MPKKSSNIQNQDSWDHYWDDIPISRNVPKKIFPLYWILSTMTLSAICLEKTDIRESNQPTVTNEAFSAAKVSYSARSAREPETWGDSLAQMAASRFFECLCVYLLIHIYIYTYIIPVWIHQVGLDNPSCSYKTAWPGKISTKREGLTTKWRAGQHLKMRYQ